jgi:hypothetical protein
LNILSYKLNITSKKGKEIQNFKCLEEIMKKHLVKCPSCSGDLKISQYHCPSCGIDINGEFEGCMFCNLDDEDRYFALVFLQTGGNIRDVERVMGISYPTVKSKLAQLLEHLGVSPEKNHVGSMDEGFARHFGRRHDHRDEVRRIKKGIRDNVHNEVHRSIRKAMKSVHIHLEEEGNREDETKDLEVDIGTVLSDLKDGRIDVTSALKRLKGEEGEKEGKEENVQGKGEEIETENQSKEDI